MTRDEAPEPITPAIQPAVLALNNAFATELSWLDANRLASMLAQSFHARQIGGGIAFLLAFDERAGYDSPNYLWFRERYRRFVYVDRLAVAPAARGRGLAKQLYADLMLCAAASGHDALVCEVNSDPANPASDALHAALGFAAVGMGVVGTKTVRYLARATPHA